LKDNTISETLGFNDNVLLKNGVLTFNTKGAFLNLYEEVKTQGAESYYNNNIKNLENFKTLRPYFNESENTQFELFLIKKKKKEKENSNYYSKVNPCSQLKNNVEVLELDDNVIIDNNFAILLNDDREIAVEGILYRYQENGVFQVEEARTNEFRSYMNGNPELNNTFNDESYGFQLMDYRIEYFDDCSSGGGSGGSGSSTITEPDFYKAKLNFDTAEFSKNPSLWGGLFGYARTETVGVPDNKRMKLKFWNRNYVLFKSFGTEIRFQKEVSFLGISGWQKSYPDKIALGINHLQYNYDQGGETYFSPSVFNSTIYSFNGYNYYPNGQLAPNRIPKIVFPVTELLGGTNSLDVFITNPFSDFDFEINRTAEEYANDINQASAALLDLGIQKGVSWLGLKPSTTTTMFTTKFLKNGTLMTISNKNWFEAEENNITIYLDMRVPTITVKADIGASGQSFFSNPSIPFPELNLDNYKTSAVDFYGAVLYKNKWYGKRMVSNDFKRK
tara:strand:+ start:15731 stop:17239 length:1509 start_codon:yes stop_codon:yes gene_type:complete